MFVEWLFDAFASTWFPVAVTLECAKYLMKKKKNMASFGRLKDLVRWEKVGKNGKYNQ